MISTAYQILKDVLQHNASSKTASLNREQIDLSKKEIIRIRQHEAHKIWKQVGERKRSVQADMARRGIHRSGIEQREIEKVHIDGQAEVDQLFERADYIIAMLDLEAKKLGEPTPN